MIMPTFAVVQSQRRITPMKTSFVLTTIGCILLVALMVSCSGTKQESSTMKKELFGKSHFHNR